jgi:hypothetical protein
MEGTIRPWPPGARSGCGRRRRLEDWRGSDSLTLTSQLLPGGAPSKRALRPVDSLQAVDGFQNVLGWAK